MVLARFAFGNLITCISRVMDLLCSNMCLSPITIVNPRYRGKNEFINRAEKELASRGALPYLDYTLRVPCGVCSECLSKRRSDFAFRVIYEMEHSYNPKFITLTYDNDHLPEGSNLSKDDAKTFLKYCSNHLPFKYRYYLCGEYGEEKGRPHLHVCMMPSSDHSFDWDSFLLDAWKNGIRDVLDLNPERCAYCCKYSVKQVGMNYNGRVKPFHLFSKSLGIGFIKNEYGGLTDDARYIQESLKPEYDGHRLSRYYLQKLFDPFYLRVLSQRESDKRNEKFFAGLHGDVDRSILYSRDTNRALNRYNFDEKKVYVK